MITGCGSAEKIDSKELEKIVVQKSVDETMQDDFIFRLVSEKEQYKVGEDVKLYGEIFYKGDKEEITIYHSSSAISFNVIEKIRGHEIGYIVKEIGTSTTLNRLGKPYRAQYNKSSVYNPDNIHKDYARFMENFSQKEGFPSGYYIVKGTTDFFVESQEKLYKLEATIDFKVVE